jgi:MinD-like ATPase involved in chromosome partitioning or flagellar assembly
MDEENSDLVNPISNSIMANPMTNQELMNPISKKDLSVEINKQFSVELHNEKNSEINQNIRKDQNTIEDQVVFLNRFESNFIFRGVSQTGMT